MPRWTQAGENLVLKHYYHIGIAVDTPDGLVVPVMRDCEQKSRCWSWLRELAEVSQRARDGKLKPADWQGASFQHLQPGRHRRHLIFADHQFARGGDTGVSRAPACNRFGMVSSSSPD